MQNVFLKGLVCASVLLGMTGRAAADNGDFLGGLVGGMPSGPSTRSSAPDALRR